MEASKENKIACLKLIDNFRSLAYFSRLEPNDLKIMAGALVKSCRDLDHAARVVETWIEGNREHPTPADLHRLAREVAENPEAVHLPSACDLCREIPGYILTEITVKTGVFAGETRSALALCGCERGHALGEAALRSKREASKPTAAPGFQQIGKLL